MLVSGCVDQTPVHTSQTLGHEQKRTGLQVDFTMQTEPSLTPTSKIHKDITHLQSVQRFSKGFNIHVFPSTKTHQKPRWFYHLILQ